MILRTRSAAGATLALLLATTFPALAGASVFGKKKVEQDTMPGRKLTAAQNALIDKAILREKDVTKVVKERAPLEMCIRDRSWSPPAPHSPWAA